MSVDFRIVDACLIHVGIRKYLCNIDTHMCVYVWAYAYSYAYAYVNAHVNAVGSFTGPQI